MAYTPIDWTNLVPPPINATNLDRIEKGIDDVHNQATLIQAIVRRIQESGGPTTLVMAAVADGEYLKRNGATIDGGTPAGAGLDFVRADKDADGDFDALTAAAWENVTKAGAAAINLNAVFGVPADAKVVCLWLLIVDAAGNKAMGLKAKVTTTNDSLGVRTQVANIGVYGQGNVPIAADGTIYYNFPAAVDSFWMRVVGWYV